MWFSVWIALATGGGGAGAVPAPLAALSSAFRNVVMRNERTTTDFFINPPFASGRTNRRGIIAISGRQLCPPFCERSEPRFLRFYGQLENLNLVFFQFLQRSGNITSGLHKGGMNLCCEQRLHAFGQVC